MKNWSTTVTLVVLNSIGLNSLAFQSTAYAQRTGPAATVRPAACDPADLRDFRRLQSALLHVRSAVERSRTTNSQRDVDIRAACETLRADLSLPILLSNTGNLSLRDRPNDRVTDINRLPAGIANPLNDIATRAQNFDCTHQSGRLMAELFSGTIMTSMTVLVTALIGATRGPAGAGAGYLAGLLGYTHNFHSSMTDPNSTGAVGLAGASHPDDLLVPLYRSLDYLEGLQSASNTLTAPLLTEWQQRLGELRSRGCLRPRQRTGDGSTGNQSAGDNPTNTPTPTTRPVD